MSGTVVQGIDTLGSAMKGYNDFSKNKNKNTGSQLKHLWFSGNIIPDQEYLLQGNWYNILKS